MTLHQTIVNDMREAMKSKGRDLAVLRMLNTSLTVYTKDKKAKSVENNIITNDDIVVQIIKREIVDLKVEIEANENVQRQDKVDTLKLDLEKLQSYLPEEPEPLTEAELTSIITEAIQSVGATSKAQMGKVMAVVMPQTKDRADGAVVKQLVAKLLP